VTTVSVITGAGGAMGEACALALAPEVDVILLTDLDGPRLDAVAQRVQQETTTKVDALRGDVGEGALVHELAGRARALGELRALAHTAGLSPSMAEWREIVRVDLAAVRLLLDAFLPGIVPGSVAVCIASIAGHVGSFDPAVDAVCDEPLAADFDARFRAVAGQAPEPGDTYRIAKRAVIRYCERAAVAWGKKGGRVLSLSPGLIDTGMGRLELEHHEIKHWMAATTPVGRGRAGPDVVLPGLTDDIANAVAFLCSDKAAFLSGCDIRVDGGLVAAMNHLPPT
jgi:NAD(P)-dependent dehydrogenase (short-subunit alcohol dehydrogenase family)